VSNFHDTVDRHAAWIRAFKKVFKVADLDEGQKAEVRTAIGKLITKWQSLERSLAPAAEPEQGATPTSTPKLNALGKPLSPNYDPNWRRKIPLTSIGRLAKSQRGVFAAAEADKARAEEAERAEAEAEPEDTVH
jgi:hypothetical protein